MVWNPSSAHPWLRPPSFRPLTASDRSLQPRRRGVAYQGVDQASTGRLSTDLLRIVIAILLPPLGVFLQVGIGKHFWINVLLTILGYIPGIIHAIWVISKY